MIHYELDGTAVTPEIALPSTGSFDTYASVATTGIKLPKGYHVLRLVMDTGIDDGFAGDFDWFSLEPIHTAQPLALSSARVAQPDLFANAATTTQNPLDGLL
jgi:hypothetical protein